MMLGITTTSALSKVFFGKRRHPLLLLVSVQMEMINAVCAQWRTGEGNYGTAWSFGEKGDTVFCAECLFVC